MVSTNPLSESLPMALSPPHSIYQPSIYSGYSYPNANPNPTHGSRNSSCERLLPKKPLVPKPNVRYSGPRTSVVPSSPVKGPTNRKRTSTDGTPIVKERRRSYGIGGAGNIRRPSEVIYPPRTNADGTRRLSSTWSGITAASPSTSPEGIRNTLWNLFGRKGSMAATGAEVEGYKEPQLGEAQKD